MRKWFVNDEKRRILRIVVSGVALALSLGDWVPGSIDVAWIAILLCGGPIVIGAAVAIVKEHNIKADMLVSMALIGSLIAKEYFAAGEVAFIMEIGSALEDYTSGKAKKGIEKLVSLLPKTARVRREGVETVIPSEQVLMGDTLSVLAGETIPVDGVITKGNTSIDQSVMTGESIPVDKTCGDSVISGTVNQYGAFEMRATSVEKDSALQRMILLAREADENRAPIVTLADKWATWVVLAAFAAALITGFITWNFLRAVTVLIVVCPCAFILATPTAIMAAIGNATRRGVLVKSGDSLQRFSEIHLAAFDKTGTLTVGTPSVTHIESLSPRYNSADVLRLAALAEQRSEHPLGKAILEAYLRSGNPLANADAFEMAPGNGVEATVDGMRVLAGKAEYLENCFVDMRVAKDRAHVFEGKTLIHIAANGEAIGIISLSDTLRTDVPEMIAHLRALNVEPVLLTGDNESVACEIAKQAYARICFRRIKWRQSRHTKPTAKRFA